MVFTSQNKVCFYRHIVPQHSVISGNMQKLGMGLGRLGKQPAIGAYQNKKQISSVEFASADRRYNGIIPLPLMLYS